MIVFEPKTIKTMQGLKGSQTEENLMRAFAGESQARNRYTIAAATTKKNNLHVIESVFTFTANQEREHAEIFYNFLKECTGSSIFIDGGYPVDVYDDVYSLLDAAMKSEHEEHDDVYKNFGEIAEQEGFLSIAQAFKAIGAIEKTHGDRFGHFAKLIKDNQLFLSETDTSFVCLNCGHVHTGKEVPDKCPVCQHDRGYFIRQELMPWGKF